MADVAGIRLSGVPCGLTLCADRRWLAEAIENLLDNAVKYCNRGNVIQVFAEETPVFLCIYVKDNGPGIRISEQGLIFQRFYRSKSASSESGLGIGLYLTREIIAKHGGYVDLRSAPGKGADFRMQVAHWSIYLIFF